MPFSDIITTQIRLTARQQLLIECPATILAGDMIATLYQLKPKPVTEQIERHVHEDVVGVIFASYLRFPVEHRRVVLNDGALNVATSLGKAFVVFRLDSALHFRRKHINGGEELHIVVHKHAAKDIVTTNEMDEAIFIDDARLKAACHTDPAVRTVSHGFPKMLTFSQKRILHGMAYCCDLSTIQYVFVKKPTAMNEIYVC